jgi:hypothetical protein
MSWFGTEGQKLERREQWEKAAEWYEKQGQSDDALRCWKHHHLYSEYGYAKCLERHNKYLEAAQYYLSNYNNENFTKVPDPRDQIRGAVRCYKAANRHEEGANIIVHEYFGSDIDKDIFAFAIEEAAKLCVDGKLYGEAIKKLCTGHRYFLCYQIIDIFLLAKKELSHEKFIEFIREFWGRFVFASFCTKDEPFDFLHTKLGAVFQITDSLGADPFVKDIVHSFIYYILNAYYVKNTGYVPELVKNKKGWSLKECSEMLRGCRPILAVEFCQVCLKDRLLPLPSPVSEKSSWDDLDKESETVWLIQLSYAYINADEQEKAIEVYTSRYRFGEAAEVLEYLDRFDEAVALLEMSGSANYRTRDTSWDKQIIDPLVRERLWKEKIAQLKGKIAATEHLKKPEEKPQKPSIDELEKMLALGEITQEEFVQKSKSANLMP